MILREIARDTYIKAKFYRLKKSDSYLPCFVLFIDDGYHKKHTGLMDRMKAIVGTYYIAKQSGLPYMLSHHSSFKMEQYLIPNRVNWQLNSRALSFSLLQTKLFTYKPHREIPVLDNHKQYHCYFYTGHNIIREQVGGNWEKTWRELFYELFKPSERLQSLINLNKIEGHYVAVHFRFVNALDRFEKENDLNLSERDRAKLIDRCMLSLEHIKENESGNRIVVFSDSVRFLRAVKDKGYDVLDSNNIGHVSFSTDEKVHDKTFVDLFAMANADRVYSVRGDNLYNSVFSQYAAIIGNGEYRIECI